MVFHSQGEMHDSQKHSDKRPTKKPQAGPRSVQPSKHPKSVEQTETQLRSNTITLVPSKSSKPKWKRTKPHGRALQASNAKETNLLRHLTTLPAWPATKAKRRARKRNPPKRRRQPCRKSPLLSLPSEIRNLIYSFVVPPARIFICGNKPNLEREVLQGQWENQDKYVKRPRYRLSHLLDNDDIDDGLVVSSSLLLVCRKITDEVELYMYSRLTFCFGSMSVAHRFLNVASKQGIKHIESLELHHTGHGQPTLSSNSVWKERYDRRWQATCTRLANDLTSLKSLKLQMSVHDWPVTLTERDSWHQTAMSLSANGLIDHVDVRLQHPRVGQPKMIEVSRKLEDRMMNERGRRARDEKEANEAIARYYEAEAKRRARWASLPPVQAKRVLSITMRRLTQENDDKPALKEVKKYYNTRTKGFAKDFDSLPREYIW